MRATTQKSNKAKIMSTTTSLARSTDKRRRRLQRLAIVEKSNNFWYPFKGNAMVRNKCMKQRNWWLHVSRSSRTNNTYQFLFAIVWVNFVSRSLEDLALTFSFNALLSLTSTTTITTTDFLVFLVIFNQMTKSRYNYSIEKWSKSSLFLHWEIRVVFLERTICIFWRMAGKGSSSGSHSFIIKIFRYLKIQYKILR